MGGMPLPRPHMEPQGQGEPPKGEGPRADVPSDPGARKRRQIRNKRGWERHWQSRAEAPACPALTRHSRERGAPREGKGAVRHLELHFAAFLI